MGALRRLRAARHQRRLQAWVRADDGQGPPLPAPGAPLGAVIGTWLEADVVEATVRNARTQGCDPVLLVDNDSPDDTVAVAVAAGARLAERYASDRYREGERVRRMQAAAETATAAVGARHHWWLFLDADELPHGPGGRTIAEHLAGLPAAVRVVGSRTYNHFPDGDVANDPGRHPADRQLLCQERTAVACRLGHWKHPLLRFDADGPSARMRPGFHNVACSTTLLEAAIPIISHHFPYRDRLTTAARLQALRPPGGVDRLAEDEWALSRRATNVDAIYRHDWAAVDTFDMLAEGEVLAPRPWAEVADPADVPFARWY